MITGNSSTAGGGGIYLYSGSDAKITDVIIKENIGGWGGGGMYIEGSDAELTNVHIHSNDDGGVKFQNADVSFNYVTISDNESYGMHIEYSEPTFNHVTIVNNDTYGVGLYSTWSHPVFTNSIIANNGTQVTTNQGTGPYGISISYSNIQGGLAELDSLGFHPDSVNWGEGNIDADPLFCGSNSSLSFDGIDDYVQTNLYLDSLPYTITCRFNSFVSSGERSIVDTDIGGHYGHSIILGYGNGDNTIDVQYHNGSYNSPAVYSANTWYTATATYENGLVKLYVDGNFIGSESYTQSDPDGSTVRFGRHNSGDPQWFNGLIKKVAIWGKALTAAEISAVYDPSNTLDLLSNSGDYASSGDLIGYWDSDHWIGDTTLTDLSGNGNDGTINGCLLYTSPSPRDLSTSRMPSSA